MRPRYVHNFISSKNGGAKIGNPCRSPYLVGMEGWKIAEVMAGTLKLDGGAMFGVVPKTIWNSMLECDEENRCTWAMRCLLLERGSQRILVDTGMGDKQSARFFSHYEPTGHTIVPALEAMGIPAHSITDVLFTHLHFDHCGGAVLKESGTEVQHALAFPMAKHWVSKAHWQHAMHPNPREKASFLKENLLPLEAAGVLHWVEDGFPYEGIQLETVFGHTESQILPIIQDFQGQEWMYMADLIPSAHHIRLPFVMGYDIRPLETLKEKERILKDCFESGRNLIFEHDLKTQAAKLAFDGLHYSMAEALHL